MATFLTMQNSVYAVLRDSEKAFVVLAEVKEWINEAQLDLVARTGLLQKAATGTTTSAGKVALPSDFLRETSFAVDSDDDGSPDALVAITSDDLFNSYKLPGSTPGITVGRIFGADIETYPAVVSEAYSLEYIYKPVVLTADGDIPAVPEETHVKLVNYARAQAKYKEGEPGEGDSYLGFYLDGLPGSPTGQYRKRPGPFGFAPEPSYWDSEYWGE